MLVDTSRSTLVQGPTGPAGRLLDAVGRITAGWTTEVWLLFKLAAPLVLFHFMTFFINFITVSFCGHSSQVELTSSLLASAVVNVTGICVGNGLAMTCDTLVSQTYGSGNRRRVGMIVQKAVLIMLLACFPCWAILINTEPLLLLVRQDPKVASLAQLYVNIFMPALPACFMFQLQGRYLHNQGFKWPQVWAGLIGNFINATLNAILRFGFNMGLVGFAITNTVTQYVMAVALFGYIKFMGLHKATWSGWSWDCLRDWKSFLVVAIPSLMMLCLEFWVFELGTFLAGLISSDELGAQGVLYHLIGLNFMFPLGLSAAASVRVGGFLGSGDVADAKRASTVSIVAGSIMAVFIGIFMILVKDSIGYVFTTELSIIRRVSEVSLVYGFLYAADAVAGVTGGVLRGIGAQKLGAVCNFVGYYIIGLPIGISLMFAAKIGIYGLGIGISICVGLQCIAFGLIIWRVDWEKAARKAQERAGVLVREQQQPVTEGSVDETEMDELNEESELEASTAEDVDVEVDEAKETLVHGSGDEVQASGDEVRADGSKGEESFTDGAQEEEAVTEQAKEEDANGSPEEEQEEQAEEEREEEREADQSHDSDQLDEAEAGPGSDRPMTQLLLRRGLVWFIMIVILCVAVAIKPHLLELVK